MSDFGSLLHAIAMRPGMYVGRCSLRSVSDYVHGYDHALNDLGQSASPLAGWMRWVELHFLISHPAWHWTRILLHVYGSDAAAIEALPHLHELFLAQRAALGVEGIEAELDRRLRTEHGFPCYEPPETSTSVDA